VGSLTAIRTTLCIVMFLAFGFRGVGQEINAREIDRLEVSEFVYDFDQLHDGRMCFATDQGLTIFDGVDNVLLVQDSGLIEDFVVEVVHTKTHLFVRYFTSGYSVIDVRSHIDVDSIVHKRKTASIVDFEQDSSGVYFLTDSGGIFKTDGRTVHKVTDIGVRNVKALKLYEDDFVVLSDSLIDVFSLDGEWKQSFVSDFHLQAASRRVRNFGMCITSKDTLPIVLSSTHGKYHIRYLEEARFERQSSISVSNDDKVLYIGSRREGLEIITLDDNGGFLSSDVVNEQNGLKNDLVQTTLVDQQGNLWISHYGAGPGFISAEIQRILNVGESITSFVQLEETGWLTTALELIEFDVLNLEIKQRIPLPAEVSGLKNLVYSEQSNDLIGSLNNRLIRIDLDHVRFDKIELPDWDPLGIIDLEVFRNKLSISSENGLGIYDLQRGTLRRYDISSGLPANRVLTTLIDHKDESVIVGLDGGGVIRIDTNGEKVTMPLDVSNYRINCLFGQGDLLFISSLGDGLHIWTTDHFYNVASIVKEAPLDKFILSGAVVEDSLLFLLSRERGTLAYLNGSQSVFPVRSIEGLDVTNTDLHVSQGQVIFASNDQLIKEKLYVGENALRSEFDILFSGLVVNNDNRDIKDGELIELESGYHRVEVGFLSPNFAKGDPVLYEYKLEPIQDKWIQSKMTENLSFYGSLGPGEYVFNVRLIDNPKSLKTFRINIAKPLWQRPWFIITFGIVLIITIIVTLYVRERYHANLRSYLTYQIKKRTRTIEEQNERIVNINNEIKDSIVYAQRIQQTILPSEESVRVHLESGFVHYRPKDIVAGDFYWLENIRSKSNEDEVIFASADCTGHGVPGAFVSIVCSNAMNQTVNEYGVHKPSDILDSVLRLVVDQFDRSTETVWDGMDIALCNYNPGKRKLQYAGANNPLWLVRKKTDEGEQLLTVIESSAEQEPHEKVLSPSQEIDDYVLFDVVATKQPIGKYDYTKPFVNNELITKEGDVVFTFSDGFPDQFGGPRDKKYRYKPFKRFLLSIAHLSPEEQHSVVSKEFTDWKGEGEQIDDVIIWGVSF